MSGIDGDHKYKGTGSHVPRTGLSRLRRAAESSKGRQKGWERHAEDEDFLDREAATKDRGTHLGESLLARFNRVAHTVRDAPAHSTNGRICGFAGRTLVVRRDDGREVPCEVRQALLKKFRGVRNPLVVGDRVRLTEVDGQGMIEATLPRTNILARADSHNRALLHQLAANIDLLVVVTALIQPDFKPGFLDRYLLIAASNNIPAIIVFNKCDLIDTARASAAYNKIGYDTFSTCAHREADPGIAALRAALRNKTAVVAGQSGVGKSSILNCLHPDLAIRVGRVSDDTGKGRHTTTSSRSFLLDDGSEIIDTPGIRECGITGMEAIDVALLFPDIAHFHRACHFNDCSHRHEPECAVLAAVARGDILPTRYESYRAILSEDLANPG